MGEEDALLHRESLLVIAASDAEDISFPFVTKRVCWNFLRNLLVVEDATRGTQVRIDFDKNEDSYGLQSSLFIKVEEFLCAGGWV